MYDNNQVTIEGQTPLAFSEDVAERFRAYGWNVLHVTDGNDCAAIAEAFQDFRNTRDAPTLIVLDTVIGYGSPLAGTAKAHSDAMGAEAVAATKRSLGWPENAHFRVPEGVADEFPHGDEEARGLVAGAMGPHRRRLARKGCIARRRVRLPHVWHVCPMDGKTICRISMPDEKGMASRAASGEVLNAIATAGTAA